MNQLVQASQLVAELKLAMQKESIWLDMRPSAEAFASKEPFCIDTMTFAQWLQFVFVERMQALIDAKATLPTNASITPLAEEYFKLNGIKAPQVIETLSQLDRLMS